jgi:hypothetical protein
MREEKAEHERKESEREERERRKLNLHDSDGPSLFSLFSSSRPLSLSFFAHPERSRSHLFIPPFIINR